jgi:hypothetical protein
MLERMAAMPSQAHEAVIWPAIMKDMWEANGLNPAGRIKTEQQMADERNQQARAAAAQAAAQSVAAQPQGDMNGTG